MEGLLPKQPAQRTVAYLRISTNKQELEKNKAAIRELADRKGLSMPEWVEEVASSRIHWKQRKIGEIVTDLKAGDRILVSEMSRLGRSMMEIMTILNTCVEKRIDVHAVKGEWSLDGTIQSKVMAMAFSIAAEIERDLISKRTTEALAARKAKGVRLGRPAGKSKLDTHEEDIREMLSRGATQRFIAKSVGCTESTLSAWLTRKQINPVHLRDQVLSLASQS